MHHLISAVNGWYPTFGLRIAIKNFQKRRQARKAYLETMTELSKLSDKELDDIGLHRGNISAVANEVYYDNIEKL